MHRISPADHGCLFAANRTIRIPAQPQTRNGHGFFSTTDLPADRREARNGYDRDDRLLAFIDLAEGRRRPGSSPPPGRTRRIPSSQAEQTGGDCLALPFRTGSSGPSDVGAPDRQCGDNKKPHHPQRGQNDIQSSMRHALFSLSRPEPRKNVRWAASFWPRQTSNSIVTRRSVLGKDKTGRGGLRNQSACDTLIRRKQNLAIALSPRRGSFQERSRVRGLGALLFTHISQFAHRYSAYAL